MKKPLLKILSISLCTALLLVGIGVTSYALTSDKAYETDPEPTATSAKAQNELPAKDETVYVIAGADGTVEKIIVSDWIKNSLNSAVLTDCSELTDIENVKGEETYSMNSDGTKVWDTQGNDIYYQGSIEKELPVSLTVSYQLDGEPISAEELAGKSGRVTIRFDYTNNQYEYVKINGKTEKIYVPFAMLTGMLLDNDVFTNVEVSNGKILNDGNHTAVVGAAFPGLQENLALDSETFEFPNYVEISANVKHFELTTTMTLATNAIFNELDVDEIDSLEDLDSALNDLTDAMDQLMDGSVQLYNGLDTLLNGANDICGGISQLADGLNTLAANSSTLNDGAKQVFDSLLSAADTQLAAAGLELPALTIDNYASVLDGVLSSMDESAVINTARTTVEQTVREQEATILAAVTDAVQQEITVQVQAAVRSNAERQVLAAIGMDLEAYQAGIAGGVIPAEQQARVEAAVEQQMNMDSVRATITANVEAQMQSDEVRTMITAKTEEQIQALIEQNMASEEVQSQITAGLAQASAGAESIHALKAQLDSYQTFYQGLITYTNGVADAAAGANTLNAVMPEFISGMTELRDGALQLSNGLAEFNEQGVQKLVDVLDGDLNGLLDRLRATTNVSKNYRSFAGISNEMDGEVKFIYKTDSIKSEND